MPVFYQKHFINSNGLLWVYDRAGQRYQELPPQVVCVERDLYAFKPKDGPRDQRVESSALATADGMCASAVRNLTSGTLPPSPETSETIAYFVGLQSARLPWNREHISAIYRNTLEEMMRLNTVSVDRMKSVLNHYAKETGDTVNVSAESMVEAVRQKQIQLTVTERPFLHHLFDQAEFVAGLLSQMSWDILDAPPQTGFVLCDDPLAIVPSRGGEHIGLGIPGTVKYFPLTRQRCLRIGDIGNVFVHRKIDSHSQNHQSEHSRKFRTIHRRPGQGTTRKCSDDEWLDRARPRGNVYTCSFGPERRRFAPNNDQESAAVLLHRHRHSGPVMPGPRKSAKDEVETTQNRHTLSVRLYSFRSGTKRGQAVLFWCSSSTAHKTLRKALAEEQKLDAMISLPSGVF